MLKILQMIASLDTDTGKAPEWVLLFAAGWGRLADGKKFLVDQAGFKLMMEAIRSRGNQIHFDYEHASVQHRGEIAAGAPAAGWIEELAWEDGKGIMARVSWTDKAAAHLAAREYKYFSPVFGIKKSDKRVCYLDSVALTNRPKTDNLTPILAALEAGMVENEETIMDREKLIAALGLAEDATDDMIVAAIAALGVKLPEGEAKEVMPERVTAALGLKPDDTVSVVEASILALKQTASTGATADQLKALEDRLAERDAADAVAAAMDAGKVTPAQKDWAMDYARKDLDGFKVYVAKASVVVPMDKLPGRSFTPDDSKNKDAVMQVAGMMDVDPDDLTEKE
jgi:phage I-like protein